MTTADILDAAVRERYAPDAIGPAFVTLPQMLKSGLTYRQIDHWTTRGWLVAETASPGTGFRRCYRYRELRVARIACRLIAVGFKTETAVSLARAAIDEDPLAGTVRVRVGSGMWLEIENA